MYADPSGLICIDVVGIAFGVTDVAAGAGEIVGGFLVFTAGALSGVDDGTTGVAVMAYGGLTMFDGLINIANGIDGENRDSAFVQAGGFFLGAHGATLGKIAERVPTPSNIGNGFADLSTATCLIPRLWMR